MRRFCLSSLTVNQKNPNTWLISFNFHFNISQFTPKLYEFLT